MLIIIAAICLAIYAIFSFLEIKIIRDAGGECIDNFIEKHKDEIIPKIVDSVINNLTYLFEDKMNEFIELSALNAIKNYLLGLGKYANEGIIQETREKDNKKSQGD